jgi:rhodanese-related sulfurtransferase
MGTITAESTMREVLTAYPGAQRAMMRRYHIGGCSSCGFAPEDRLGDVLKKHNVLNTAEVIEHVRTSHEQEQKLQVSPAELKQMQDAGRGPKLIDVRSPEEIAHVNIEGSLPASQQLVQEMMQSWPKDTPIVCYCHHGMRSLDAASYLIGHGFTNVRSLTGGIDAWAEQIEPGMKKY